MSEQQYGHEGDYQRRVDSGAVGRFLDGTKIEIMLVPEGLGEYQHALFDFDGTLSLIREGWPEVMAPLMMEVLFDAPNPEPENELRQFVDGLISRTTGKQTIYQMINLCDVVRERGGNPSAPEVYKQKYTDLLMERIEGRREGLRSGRIRPEDMLVPGTYTLLEALRERGVQVYLASGTDECFVLEEAELLGLVPYFNDHIYGAIEDYANFSKAMVIDRILKENGIDGAKLLGFGDGFVEIDNVKSVGGTAVGVASDETNRSGEPDAWKRERLVGVGADIIVPDFGESDALINYLFGG
jgi:phosphoglycolate phosphatase